jgi:tellurite resistance protein TerC
MFAGASMPWWIGFHVAVVALLLVDAFLPVSHDGSRRSHRMAWIWSALLIALAGVFAVWIGIDQGRQIALEFVAGYAIELSLSVDNLFVFLVIFEGFHVSEQRQHTALLWGVAGAIVLRALFIAVGVTLIDRFDWVNWIFGAILLYAAFRLVRGGSARAAIPGWIRRMQTPGGSLLPVIIAIEMTDLLFAVDSIPAVLGVSHDPFVVYTSNIAAILGLRSLYFALAALLDRLRYLHYGLGALLGFIGLKMMASQWLEVPITISLAVMGAILAVCAIVSWIAGGKPRPVGAGKETSH